MVVMVDEPQAPADKLLADFLSFDTPEGYRAELIDGEIVVTPPPLGGHEQCIAEINLQIVRNSPRAFHCSGNKGLTLPGASGHPRNYVIPDATFALADLELFRGASSWMPVEADGIAMVVEVTSTNPERDRGPKRDGYARARIPLYLLVDRKEERVILFSGSDGKEYRHVDHAPIGEKLLLPEPFEIELDTSRFD
ncbi:Uma2 family endonuclease [Actinomadura sp. 9N215]|uniref:Uma2 family endonuclease n=1 Tax=Actinomadura sp. 9N215 TaxID=3375150 RepID=UPI0037A4BCB6